MTESTEADDSPVSPSRSLKVPAGVAIFATFFLLSVLITAFIVDQHSHRDRVSRNVTLAGENIEHLTRDELTKTVAEVDAEYRAATIQIEDKDTEFSIPATSFGLSVDSDQTVDAALKTTKSGNTFGRFGTWLKGFFSASKASVKVDFDQKRFGDALNEADKGLRVAPIEPSFRVEDNKLVAIAGTNGEGLDVAAAADELRDEAASDASIEIEADRVAIPPRFTTSDAERLIGDVESKVLTPLTLRAGTTEKTLDAATMRPWVGTVPGPTSLGIRIFDARVGPDLEKLFADAGVKPREPGFVIADNRPVIIDGRDGAVCCDAPAATIVSNVLNARMTTPFATPVEIPLRVAKFTGKVEDLPPLNIVEPISSFTTNYAPGQPRVTNIHRISDLVRGQIIKPGATFSLNGAVGRRTTENGFVVDHVIEDGKFAEAVGGGISQFATTLFNAAFFGGLDFGEYQAHTIYIDRYPYGREATIAFPHPDLQIRNTTPHGILIWPAYTNRSVTVTLYSTRFASGEQTNQTTAPRGVCTRVTTERTRTYMDGRKSVDNVFATYQPEEGKKC